MTTEETTKTITDAPEAQTDSTVIKTTPLLEMAKRKAMEAHKGQKRRGGGDVYNEHILPVAKAATNYLENNHNGHKIALKFADLILKPYHYHKIILETTLDEAPINEQIIAAAYLHDVEEDTDHKIDEFPNITRQLVRLLTKQPTDNYYTYLMRIMDHPLIEFATIIKLADLENNMKTTEEGPQKDKYRLAQHILKNK